MLECECVATYIHVLHSLACVSKTPLTGVQRHKSRRQKKTRSLCKLTCAHHIRLSSTALLDTWQAVAQRFPARASGQLCLCSLLQSLRLSSSCAAAAERGDWCKNIVGFFSDHKKRRNPWEQHIRKPNKQTAMYEKKAAFFLQLKKPQIPGKLQIKKANKQDEICRWKVYRCKLSLQNIKNIRFMIASAAFTELFLNIDIYYTIYLLLSVHFQRTNAEKKLTVVTQPGSGLIVLIIKPIPCELLWGTQEDALTKSPIDCLYWCTFFSYYFWMLHVFVCWESPPEVSNSFYHLFSISHSRNGGSEVCP